MKSRRQMPLPLPEASIPARPRPPPFCHAVLVILTSSGNPADTVLQSSAVNGFLGFGASIGCE